MVRFLFRFSFLLIILVLALSQITLEAKAQSFAGIDWTTAQYDPTNGGYCDAAGWCAAPAEMLPLGLITSCNTAWCAYPSWTLCYELGMCGGIGGQGGACDYSPDCYLPVIGIEPPPCETPPCPGSPPPGGPPPTSCPAPTTVQQPPTLSITKVAPENPLVIGQDPEQRGADIRVSVTVPPVILTWYEEVQDPPTCQYSQTGEGGGCPAPGEQYGEVIGANGEEIEWQPYMEDNVYWEAVEGEIYCISHVNALPEAVIYLLASAQLNAESQQWILDDLAGKYYEAYLHQPNINLVPGMAIPNGGCGEDGVCTAEALISRTPFADPGTFNLLLWVITSGTSFNWNGVSTPITSPRLLMAANDMQVYVTLVTLLPVSEP